MKIYKVGGCVRDQLLGANASDNDYVVVGSSVEEMIKLGFKQIGKSFPVFLHPKTKEEYALARKEKKSGVGYLQFIFDTSKYVSLYDDLKRRDLTMNAIAIDKNGKYIDYFGGVKDIRRGILKHVSRAFIEDPLRVIRVARFVATLNFKIYPSTIKIMRDIVSYDELLVLSKERKTLELQKALKGKWFYKFFRVLYKITPKINKDKNALLQTYPEFLIIYQSNYFRQFKKFIDNLNLHVNISNSEKIILIYAFILLIPFFKDKKHIITVLPISVIFSTYDFKMLNLLINNFKKILEFKKLNSESIYDLLISIDFLRRSKRFSEFTTLLDIFFTSLNNKKGKNNLKDCNDIVRNLYNLNYQQIIKDIPDSQKKGAIKEAIVCHIDNYLTNMR